MGHNYATFMHLECLSAISLRLVHCEEADCHLKLASGRW